MTSQSTTESYRAGMIQVTETVFDTLLNASVTVLDAPSGVPAYALTAAIYYAGLWQGALLIECSEQQARACSSHIMDLPDPTSEDARDGFGELANVLAGNLKPLLPQGVSISIPSVVAGSDFRSADPGTDQNGRSAVHFTLTNEAGAEVAATRPGQHRGEHLRPLAAEVVVPVDHVHGVVTP